MAADRKVLKSSALRTFIVVGASVPLVALPLFGLWVYRFLKDYRAGVYGMAFVIALALAMQVRMFRIEEGRVKIISAGLRGAIAGYAAGLVAYFTLILVIPEGASALGGAIGRSPGGSIPMILGVPIFWGGWLYGGLVGFGIEWLRGRADASSVR